MRTESIEGAARAVSALGLPQPRIVTSGNFASPVTVLAAVLAELPPPGCTPSTPSATCRCTTAWCRRRRSWVPGFRRHPRLSYVPCRLSMVPRLFHGPLPRTSSWCTPRPRAAAGCRSASRSTSCPPRSRRPGRRGALVVAQLNPRMPWTFGDAEVDVADIDLGVEVDVPLRTHLPTAPGDDARAIGALVAAQVGDGSTLQAGIGEVPDATVAGVAGRRGLRVWTEMFSDGVLALERAGSLDPDVPLTTSFVFGSDELYAWLDGNARVRMSRTEVTNAPAVIARQPRMTSVNTALQVDLFDQANASRIGARIHSGFGGQTDFTVGASHSPGGQAFLALRSWHPRADVSTIVPLVDEPVTSFQHTAVVTEQGIAWMWGRDERTQARHLIEHAAHPSVRDDLREEASALGLA